MKSIHLVIILVISFSCLKENESSFSNTQQWGKNEIYFLNKWKPFYVKGGDDFFQTEIFHYPNAKQTSIEILKLLKLQKNRTIKQRDTINREKHVCGFSIGKFRLGMNPSVDNLILDAYFDARKWGFALKKYYDRIRPSHFDKRINPSIENPPHAAYPSNHSFQAHVIAHILSDLNIENKSKYFADAWKIAKNREIAGVHYASDSIFGKKLAKSFYKILKNNIQFSTKLNKLKSNTNLINLTNNINSDIEYNHCLDFSQNYAKTFGVWPSKKE